LWVRHPPPTLFPSSVGPKSPFCSSIYRGELTVSSIPPPFAFASFLPSRSFATGSVNSPLMKRVFHQGLVCFPVHFAFGQCYGNLFGAFFFSFIPLGTLTSFRPFLSLVFLRSRRIFPLHSIRPLPREATSRILTRVPPPPPPPPPPPNTTTKIRSLRPFLVCLACSLRPSFALWLKVVPLGHLTLNVLPLYFARNSSHVWLPFDQEFLPLITILFHCRLDGHGRPRTPFYTISRGPFPGVTVGPLISHNVFPF